MHPIISFSWGATAEGGSVSDVLQELENLTIVSDAACGTALASTGATVTSDMLCAGGEKDKDGCQVTVKYFNISCHWDTL